MGGGNRVENLLVKFESSRFEHFNVSLSTILCVLLDRKSEFQYLKRRIHTRNGPKFRPVCSVFSGEVCLGVPSIKKKKCMTQQCKLFGIVCSYVDGQLMCTGSTRNDVVSSLTLL